MDKLFKHKLMFKHNMGFKTITIKESAYNRIKAAKKHDESFSEFFERTVNQKKDIQQFAGVLNNKEARALKQTIRKERKRADDNKKKRIADVLSRL